MLKFRKYLCLREDVSPLLPIEEQALYINKDVTSTPPYSVKDRRHSVAISSSDLEALSSRSEGSARTPTSPTQRLAFEADFNESRSLSFGSKRTNQIGDPFHLSIVGRQADDSILIARDVLNSEGKRYTVIGLYNIHAQEYTNVLTLNEPKVVVAASMSNDRSLLAFTTISRIRFDQFGFLPDTAESCPATNAEFIYEGWLAETNPQGHVFCIPNLTSRNFVRMFFLDRDPSKVCQLLAIVNTEKALLYKVDLQRRSSVVGMKLRSQPHLQTVVARSFLWFEWDPILNILYILQKDETSKDKGEALFRTFDFNCVKQDQYMTEDSIKLTTFSQRDMSTNVFRNPKTPCLWMNGFASPTMYMHVVRLKNAVCLCHQDVIESTDGTPSKVQITVYNISLEYRIVIEVQFSHLPLDFLKKVHVYFGALTDMLMVYIPGVYLQFVDCSPTHEASESLATKDPSYAPTIPFYADQSQCVIVPFDRTSRKQPHLFLDCLNGVIYEYSMNYDFVMEIFLNGPMAMHHLLLHMILLHLRDIEFAQQILRRVCEERPQHLTSLLIQEFLLGSTYYRLVHKHEPDRSLFRALPCTTITPLCLYSNYKKPHEVDRIFKIQYNSMSREPGTPEDMSSLHGMVLERAKNKARLTTKMYTSFSQPTPMSPKRAEQRVDVNPKEFRNRILPPKESRLTPQKDEDNTPFSPQRPYTDSPRQLMLDFYAAYLQNEKYQLDHYRQTKAAETCVNVQLDQVKKAFDSTGAVYITEFMANTPHEKKLDVLEMLENLSAALEDLCYPRLDDLNKAFCLLAFECLPRWTFLEYLRSGSIKLTDSLLNHILNHPKFQTVESSINFKFQLLSLIGIEQAIPIYRQIRDVEGSRFVLEYLLTTMPESKLTDKELYDEITETLDEDDETDESMKGLGPGESLDDPEHESSFRLKMIPENLRPLTAFHSWIRASLNSNRRTMDYTYSPSLGISSPTAPRRLHSCNIKDFDNIVRVSKDMSRTGAIDFICSGTFDYLHDSSADERRSSQ